MNSYLRSQKFVIDLCLQLLHAFKYSVMAAFVIAECRYSCLLVAKWRVFIPTYK